MREAAYELWPVGWVESPLVDVSAAPAQGDEGAPDAWIVIRPELERAMHGLLAGDTVIVVTWLDRGDRSTLDVHPRGDDRRPVQGVFNTRSSDRPNPIGLHEVEILTIEGTRLGVRNLETVDGTPVVDIKPLLGPVSER